MQRHKSDRFARRVALALGSRNVSACYRFSLHLIISFQLIEFTEMCRNVRK